MEGNFIGYNKHKIVLNILNEKTNFETPLIKSLVGKILSLRLQFHAGVICQEYPYYKAMTSYFYALLTGSKNHSPLNNSWHLAPRKKLILFPRVCTLTKYMCIHENEIKVKKGKALC